MEVGSRIPEKLFFRIGEVCELIKVQPHVLRYWETEFPMLAPQKNKAGQRVYRRKDVEMVFRIRDLLYEEKFTIAGAKKKLMDETRAGSGRSRTAAHQPTPETQEAAQPALLHTESEPEQQGTIDLLPGLRPSDMADAAPPHAPSPSPTEATASALATPARESTAESLTQHEKRVLRLIKTDLEDLLTRLNSDVTFKP
jgi:DNA-binding transcriptional MerR regulator